VRGKGSARAAPTLRPRRERAGQVGIYRCSPWGLGTREGKKTGSAVTFSDELGAATAASGALHCDGEQEESSVQLNLKEQGQ
jgi:hypothetical protein